MSVYTPPDVYTLFRYGFKVDRETATLPQTTASKIFEVVGGRVAITKIVGEVTTVIQTQANNTKLVSDPATGTAVNLCATENISALEVGGKLGITGDPTDALVKANAGGLAGQLVDVVVPEGEIKLDCAASNTGAVKWSVWYVPIDEGAKIVAV